MACCNWANKQGDWRAERGLQYSPSHCQKMHQQELSILQVLASQTEFSKIKSNIRFRYHHVERDMQRLLGGLLQQPGIDLAAD